MWSDNETSSDLLGCQHVVEVVTSIVKNESLLPATIGVFGDWGSGKSSLLQIVQERLQETEQDKKDFLVLAFNGWTFEGYEDARTALMSTILDEIASKATLTAKGRRLAVKLLSRINVMRVLGAGAKAALAFGMGGPVGLGLSAGADLATNAAALLKAGDISAEDFGKFIKAEPAQEVRRSIREFRKDFEELIDDTRLKTLVVIIDDLDRCMPDTIIETLEAIKLFLFAHKTAFILGADERLVKYAVRKRFPELPGERVEVGRDYLEKLVQFPLRVPPLGRTEIETYINLLFAKTGGLTTAQFEEARTRATTCNATTLLDVRFNHGVAAEILKPSPVPKDLADNLAMAQRIAPFLANTSGYPRQCKRFLNMVVMRLMMAKARGITLEQRVLAKLMLLEYFRPNSFKKLAELQAAEQGRPSELAQAEASIRPAPIVEVVEPEPAGKKGEAKATPEGEAKPRPKKPTPPAKLAVFEMPMWLSDEWTTDWLKSEPPLSEEDLRPYFYFSRDTLGQLGVMMPRQSPMAQQVLTELFDKSEAIRAKALKRAKELNPEEAISVFEALTEKARQEEDPTDERAALQRCFDWAKARPELIVQLFTFLDNHPVEGLPSYVVVRVLDLPETMEHWRHARKLGEKWAHQNQSMKIKESPRCGLPTSRSSERGGAVGTSKSYGGPGDKPPLLPDWALPPPEVEVPDPEDDGEEEEPPPDVGDPGGEDGSELDAEDGDDTEAPEDAAEADGGEVSQDQAPAALNGSWRSAKVLLGKAVRRNGHGRAFRRAAQSYVRARGGPHQAARTATSGRSATARLGGFLADVATRGLNAALDALNLSSVVGKDAPTVFAAISNALAPDGASPEQVVAREAVNDVLADLYERFVTEDGDISRLNALTGEDISKAVMDSVTSYIYHRWLQELGRQMEEKAISSSQAVSLEREAKLFVRDSVTLDLKGRDPLAMNWATEGNPIVERIYTEAYTLFGAGR